MKVVIRTLLLSIALSAGAAASAAPVEYVRVCSQFGSGFFYLPGTETCFNPRTGDTRVDTEGGVWRTRTPYPAGEWVKEKKPEAECKGKLVQLGTFKSTDFTLNVWARKQTAPISLPIGEGQYISRVLMSGGFYDPRLPDQRSGATGEDAFCLRSIDPSIPEVQPEPNPEDPPRKQRWGNGMLPIGCIANGRLLNMPTPYAVDADASYPSVEVGFADAEQTVLYGPFTYNSHVIVTTDAGRGGDSILMYRDASDDTLKPLAGELTVSVCVAPQVRGGLR
ncbi:MAG TPA: porin [Thermoanaerobaculia bacterium]|nr:porin [Thermoanaerobaculia bacterium]